MRTPWKLHVDVISKSFQEVVNFAQKLMNSVQRVLVQLFHSSTVEDADRVTPWLALLTWSSSREHTRRFERRLSSMKSLKEGFRTCEEKWLLLVALMLSPWNSLLMRCQGVVNHVFARLCFSFAARPWRTLHEKCSLQCVGTEVAP